MVLNTFVAAEVSLIQPAPIVDIWRNGKFSTPLGTTHNGQALSSRAFADSCKPSGNYWIACNAPCSRRRR